MSDGGTHFPLASRRAEGLMPFPVTDRSATVAAYPSLLTAGADEAESDTPDGVAADPSVVDAERDPLYGDRVTHPYKSLAEWYDGLAAVARVFGVDDSEAVRQSRLSRWQAQR